VAACSINKDGTPIQFLQQPTDAMLTDQQYSALIAQHGFTRTLEFAPTPGTVRIRLLVRDNSSGKMGSVDMPYPTVKPADTASADCGVQGPCNPPAAK